MSRNRFIGRKRELAALRSALEVGPLVTVVGPGGAGKTRLVEEFVTQRNTAVVFCDLSAARSRDAMVIALAAALDVQRATEDAIADALASSTAKMVVLDNFEQLRVEGAQALDQWLAAAQMPLVVTSRGPTHLDGERLVEVSALPLEQACQLFADRAYALSPDVVLDDDCLSEIVTRLDGLPLAIELAARCTRVLTAPQIARELDDKLDTILTPNPLAPARHATLRGVVAWSWELLSAQEQRAMAALSVFCGDFDLTAARAVLQTAPSPALQALLDQGLLRRDGERYRLLECARDFALEQRHARSDAATFEERHASHFETIADSDAARWIDDLLVVHERAVSSPATPARALRIGLVLEPLLLTRGPAPLLLRLLDGALAAAAGDEKDVGAAHLARGHVLADLGRAGDAQAAREQALAIATNTGNRLLEAKARASLGRHAWHGGRVDEALARTGEAIALFEELGEDVLLAEARSHRANFRWLQGHVEQARQDYLDALNVLEPGDDRRAEAIALGNLASLERDMGFLPEAHAHLARALSILETLDDRFHLGTFKMNLGSLHLDAGDIAKAQDCFRGALSLHRDIGNRRWEGIVLASIAQCDELTGGVEEASRGYGEGAELAARFGHPIMLAMVLCWRTRHAAAIGDIPLATSCLSRAEAVFEEVGSTLVDGLARIARAHLDLAGGDRGAAQAILQELDASGTTERSADLRSARTQLEAALGGESTALIVSRSGLGFSAPGGAWQDLSTRTALRHIVLALAKKRDEQAGLPLHREELIEAGWPAENIATEAAATRLYTAIATLRKRGLRGILVRRDDGYLLEPTVPFGWQ